MCPEIRKKDSVNVSLASFLRYDRTSKKQNKIPQQNWRHILFEIKKQYIKWKIFPECCSKHRKENEEVKREVRFSRLQRKGERLVFVAIDTTTMHLSPPPPFVFPLFILFHFSSWHPPKQYLFLKHSSITATITPPNYHPPIKILIKC